MSQSLPRVPNVQAHPSSDARATAPYIPAFLFEAEPHCSAARLPACLGHSVDLQFGESKHSCKDQIPQSSTSEPLVHQVRDLVSSDPVPGVGAPGFVVNLLFLTLFLHWGMDHRLVIGLPIGISMVWNFALNRRFSFSYARGPVWDASSAS